ncbi:MAG: SDR family NAD(P)-dependent oxidoreductase [Mucilaginibacter polytrichastri]|nr:SDR family NAD(P)-dependent oxidoreductase [Mucilaginibacter polytrichastri]
MQKPFNTSILGCGWLGLALARYWINSGLSVAGSTTQTARLDTLATAGLAPFLVQLNENVVQPDWHSFFHTDTLVIAVPPKRKQQQEGAYLEQMRSVVRFLPTTPVRQIILISSTSVYNDTNRELDESDDVDPENVLVCAENLFPAEKTTIVRFGGLIGPDRHPGRFFRNRGEIPDGDAPVNMIHQTDAVALIDFVYRNRLTGIFNGVAPDHPTRSRFYTAASAHFSPGDVPDFMPGKSNWKIVHAKKAGEKGFRFQVDDLLNALNQPIW